jgi:citrate synthase
MATQGLEGVVAATTRLSEVDGERGELIISGFPVGDLAANATFEETTWLLWNGDLPTRSQLDRFRAELAGQRTLAAPTMSLVRECARASVDPMDALRMAVDTISLDSNEGSAIVARVPTIVAAFWRLCKGLQPIEPKTDLGHAANFLCMLEG